MRRPATLVVALLALPPWTALTTGCLADSGNRYVGLKKHDDAMGRFRVWYAAPPWEEPPTLAGALGDAFALEIDSPYGELAGTGRRVYRLGISVLAEAPEAAARRIEGEILSAGHELVDGTAPIESDTDDPGFDLTWREPSMMGRYGRARTLAASFGSVLVRLEANPDPRNQDIDRMFDAIDSEPDRETPDGGP